jgi:hemoglobin
VKDTCASNDGRISEAEIRSLVVTCCSRIQSRDLPRAIFEIHVGDGWDAHLDKIWGFWSSILLATGHFRGNPIVAYWSVSDITREGFDRWLSLFEDVASDVLSSTHALDRVARAPRMRFVLEGRIAPVTP